MLIRLPAGAFPGISKALGAVSFDAHCRKWFIVSKIRSKSGSTG